jgi:DNA-binding MarR family transcriptional regulator
MVHAMGLDFDPIAEARRNWDDHGWVAGDAMVAATSITRAHQIVLGRVNTILGPLGLNFSRFEALALLSFSRSGALPLGKMGERLQVHPTSVTNTIDRLQRDGLVERVAHPTDGRTTLASLTAAGHKLVVQAQAALAAINFGLDGLDHGGLRAVGADIRPLRQHAGDF